MRSVFAGLFICSLLANIGGGRPNAQNKEKQLRPAGFSASSDPSHPYLFVPTTVTKSHGESMEPRAGIDPATPCLQTLERSENSEFE